VCATAINDGSKKGNSFGVETVETSYNMRWVLAIICFRLKRLILCFGYATEFRILICIFFLCFVSAASTTRWKLWVQKTTANADQAASATTAPATTDHGGHKRLATYYR
jgi:hypothetical protein